MNAARNIVDFFDPKQDESAKDLKNHQSVKNSRRQDTDKDINFVVAQNLKALRVKKGLSLEKLSKASGVSRAMLCQIENNQSTPTIQTLWKIALALRISITKLLTKRQSNKTLFLPSKNNQIISSADGKISSRKLFAEQFSNQFRLHEFRLLPFASQSFTDKSPKTLNHLVVIQGNLEVEIGTEKYEITKGDVIYFEGDVKYLITNLKEGLAVYHLLIFSPQNDTTPDLTDF